MESSFQSTPLDLGAVKIYPYIHYLKTDVLRTIDAPLSWEQLTGSDFTFSITRPLIEKYSRLNNMAIVYVCLVVRSYFLSQAEADLSVFNTMTARATFTEIMAMKLISHFASDRIQLAAVLTTSWSPLAGAPPDVAEEITQTLSWSTDSSAAPQSAIELAICTESKHFLASPVCQKIIQDIHAGYVVYSAEAHRSVLADNYKPKPIEVYDFHSAPFLNHYRLRVPKYNSILEFVNFTVLLVIYVLCLAAKDVNRMSVWEEIFIVFAAAFVLDEYSASIEYGWNVYMANIWNVFDACFIAVFLLYFGLRTKGLVQHDAHASELAFDILACGACILFPRLVFFAVRNNVVILSLRAMIADFGFFMGIAVICFSGLLFTLWTLASDTWTLRSIAWLMVQIWFGNTYLSFAQASSFHPFFGPILMTCFAALSNTLLLTILISILSNTFARIDKNSTQEYLFQFTINTIEGVKSDALFSYQVPFNLIAFIVLKPASFILSPRSLHSLNVFLIKLTSFPILLLIHFYERFTIADHTFPSSTAHSLYSTMPRRKLGIRSIPFLEAIVRADSADLYDAILDLDVEPAPSLFRDPSQTHRAVSRDSMRSSMTGRRFDRERAATSRPRTPIVESPVAEVPEPPTTPLRGRRAHLTSLVGGGGERLPQSPISKLFDRRSFNVGPTPAQSTMSGGLDDTIKKLENLLGDLQGSSAAGLREELKELQDRQLRIEALLIQLIKDKKGRD